MPIDFVPFNKTGYFSSLICDYLDEKKELKSFYNRFPSVDNFKHQIDEKKHSSACLLENREILVSRLISQYQNIETSQETLQNIHNLKDSNCFTVTTGHQLNLFTGPLYFLYKIVSTINLSNLLQQIYPDFKFVPVYWMATEDHDFDEINYFNFKGKKVHWNKNAKGAVGKLDTQGLDSVFHLFSQELGSSKNASKLKALFKNAYLNHSNLTDATRFLTNELFKDHGLVILDADDAVLKRQFIPYLKEELLHQTSFKSVQKTNQKLNNFSKYGNQVNPREINLFYLNENFRERIIFEDQKFRVNNSDITWSEAEILKHLNENPERFSPNVIMRPLYQEVVLPNLAYIGGGGELAYWFQLKDYFKQVNVPFPLLILRNSVLLQFENQNKKRVKLKISNQDLFLKRHEFINKKVRDISNIPIDFSNQKSEIQKQFNTLYELANETDKSFLGAVKAQEVKQLKAFDNLEKRLIKAQKRKLIDEVTRMTDLQNALFPNQSLQERMVNFSEFYLEYGDQLIPHLIKNLNPLNGEFIILNI